MVSNGLLAIFQTSPALRDRHWDEQQEAAGWSQIPWTQAAEVTEQDRKHKIAIKSAPVSNLKKAERCIVNLTYICEIQK